MDFNQFIKELKRRSVYKVVVVYGIVAWLVIQVSSILLPTFEAPAWVMKVLVLVLIVGFLIALVLAWAFEMSPQGITRTSSDETSKKHYSDTKKKPLISNLLIGILTVIIIGQFFYTKYWNITKGETDFAESGKMEQSIAVLPLINLNSKDENLDYFSDGVTQEIIDELVKIKSFAVTAFTTSIVYKNNKKSNNEIAKELNVNYLMAGTSRVYNKGDSVRLSIELIDIKKNSQRIWNSSYNEAMKDAPQIQLAIAQKVAKSLNVQLSFEEKQSLEKVSTGSGEAFKLFLQAKAEFYQLTEKGFKRAQEYLLRAVKLDANYAQAHTFLAWSYTLPALSWFPGENLSTKEVEEIVWPHLEKAIELDPSSSDNYLVRANLSLYTRNKLREAKEDVDYALKQNSWPRIPTNYCICTAIGTYAAMGDLEKAKSTLDIGKTVDPGSPFVYFDAGLIAMKEMRYEEAQELYKRTIEIMDIPIFHFHVGWSYYHNSQYEDALEHFKRAYEMSDPGIPFATAYLSNAYHKLDQFEESEYYKNVLDSLDSKGIYDLNLPKAMIAIERGELIESLVLLELSLELNESMFGYMINVNPIFDPIRSYPRFRLLRKKVQSFEQVKLLD